MDRSLSLNKPTANRAAILLYYTYIYIYIYII